MQYSVNAAGFEGHHLVVQVTGSLVTVPKLMIDEQPAPERLKRGQFLLRRNDGTEVVAEFRYTFFDPIPRVIIDGKTIRIWTLDKWFERSFSKVCIWERKNRFFVNKWAKLNILTL